MGNLGILLTDEPTGNLDSRSSEEIMAIIQQLNREEGITVVIVTHERDIAGYAQRVVSMRDGEITGDQVQKPAIAGRGSTLSEVAS